MALAAAAFGVSAAPVLRNPQLVSVGTDHISQVLCADLNNDGHDDLLVVNSGTALAAILDNGTGPFAAPVITPISYSFVKAAVADVNGDGRKDVVGVDFTSKSIVVMLGNGDGSFNAGPTSSTALATFANVLAVGDFNGDHLIDIAVGGSTDINGIQNVFAIYFGDGNGHFSGGTTTGVLEDLIGFTAADLNGDGKSDIIAAGRGGTTTFVSNGNGTFVAGSRVNDSAFTVLTADFNHDGKIDVAFGPNTYFGNGDGTLTKSATYFVGVVESFAAADLDGDGNVDLIATSSGGAMSVLRGNADGTFKTPSRLFVADVYASNINVADFDRDGKPDVVTAMGDPETNRPSLSFVRGNGDGTFQAYPAALTINAYPSLPSPPTYKGACVTADMNNDGKPDAVVIQPDPNDPYQLQYNLAVLLNDGTGRLAAPVFTATGMQRWDWNPDFAIADVNHDGKLDAVVLSDYVYKAAGVTLLGNGDGTFGTPIPITVPIFGHPYLADFDGDGIPDLFIGLGSQSTLLHGNGDGTFASGVSINAYDAYYFMLGDVNGDGKLDFVTAPNYGAAAFLNDGSGHFTAQLVTNDEIMAAALADFNSDGKLDLLFRTDTGTQVRFGNGDGTFGAPVAMTMQPAPDREDANPRSVVTGDFDGDGKTDVSFGTTTYLGNGDGTFSSRVRLRSLPITYPNVVDMDGNGSPDLVYLNYDHDVAVILTRTTSDPTVQSSITLSADATPAQYGKPVTFTATVTGGGIPFTGVVRFAVAGRPVALVTLDADGKAQYTTQFSTGSFAITATYTGDEYYIPTTSDLSLNVVKATTTVLIFGFNNPTPQGNIISISSGISSAPAYPFAPTGTITVREGATVLGSVPATGGTFHPGSLTVGSHVITADYPGDANFEPSSGSYTQVITKPVPFVGLSFSAPGGFVAGSPVTIHAFFLNTTNITGTVSFYASDVLLGTLPLVNGAADIQTSFPWGIPYIQVSYSGDSTWAAAKSPVYGLTIVIGPWGTQPAVRAVGSDHGSVNITWSQIIGAMSYSVWYRTRSIDGWQLFATYQSASGTSFSIPNNTTWEFAVTATDANGNVSAMSPPDLATTVGFTDPTIAPGVTTAKAQHITDLRTAVGAVRTFAGLGAFAYTTTPSAGQPIRTTDILELRTALSQARNAIGLPISFSDSTLTPGVTPIRAAHIIELRAGVD